MKEYYGYLEETPEITIPSTIDDPATFLGFTLGEIGTGFLIAVVWVMATRGTGLAVLPIPVGIASACLIRFFRNSFLPSIVNHVGWSLGFSLLHHKSPIVGNFFAARAERRFGP